MLVSRWLVSWLAMVLLLSLPLLLLLLLTAWCCMLQDMGAGRACARVHERSPTAEELAHARSTGGITW